MSKPSTGRTRLPNGRTKIHQDERGYYTKVSLGKNPATGVATRRTVRGRTMSEVVERVDALRSADVASITTSKTLTVAQWVVVWLKTVERTRKQTTWQAYRSVAQSHLLPALAAIPVNRVTTEHIEAIYDAALARGNSPERVAGVHRVIKACFQQALLGGHTARNPVMQAKPPRVPRSEREPLSRDECGAVLAVATESGCGARWWAAIAMGLRQGEALGLRWTDIDWEAETMFVHRTLSKIPYQHGCSDPKACANSHHRPTSGNGLGRTCSHAHQCPKRHGGGFVAGAPKSLASTRTISIPPVMVGLLVQLKADQQRDWAAERYVWDENGFVFAQVGGTPTSPPKDRTQWKKLLAQAGVRDARVHDARHTAATLMLGLKASPREVIHMFGWSTPRLLSRYQHINLEMQRTITAGISDVLTEGIDLSRNHPRSLIEATARAE